jgi:hypothetical protein
MMQSAEIYCKYTGRENHEIHIGLGRSIRFKPTPHPRYRSEDQNEFSGKIMFVFMFVLTFPDDTHIGEMTRVEFCDSHFFPISQENFQQIDSTLGKTLSHLSTRIPVEVPRAYRAQLNRPGEIVDGPCMLPSLFPEMVVSLQHKECLEF